MHRRVHHHHPDRRLPGRRPARRPPSPSNGSSTSWPSSSSIDPMELRRQNWITHEEFPYTTDRRADLRQRQLRGRDRPGDGAVRLRRAARGAAARVGRRAIRSSWASASPPSPRCAGWRRPAGWSRMRYAAGGWEHCTIRILPTGKVELVTGTSPHGQGHATAWSQIASDSLGIPVEDIEVIHGDTGRAPVRHGHLRLPVAGRRRGGHPAGRRGGGGQGQGDRRAPARGQPRRPGVRRRILPGQGRPGLGQDHPGDRLGGVHLARPAGRHRPEPVRRVHRRPAGVLLPARHPPVRGRGRHRDRA